MQWKCPLCGSRRIQTVGGENGDPFQRRPERAVCLDCGKTVRAAVGDGDRAARRAPLIPSRFLLVSALVEKSGAASFSVEEVVPYVFGSHELGKVYPFSKNVYTGPDTGYYFGRIAVGEDLQIRYLDEDPRPLPREGALVFERQFGYERITVTVKEIAE